MNEKLNDSLAMKRYSLIQGPSITFDPPIERIIAMGPAAEADHAEKCRLEIEKEKS